MYANFCLYVVAYKQEACSKLRHIKTLGEKLWHL